MACIYRKFRGGKQLRTSLLSIHAGNLVASILTCTLTVSITVRLLHHSMPSHIWASSSLSLDAILAYEAAASAMISVQRRKGSWEKSFYLDAAISCAMLALFLPAVPFSDLKGLGLRQPSRLANGSQD